MDEDLKLLSRLSAATVYCSTYLGGWWDFLRTYSRFCRAGDAPYSFRRTYFAMRFEMPARLISGVARTHMGFGSSLLLALLRSDKTQAMPELKTGRLPPGVNNDVVDTKMAGPGMRKWRVPWRRPRWPGYSSETTLVPDLCLVRYWEERQAVCKCWWKTVTGSHFRYMVKKFSFHSIRTLMVWPLWPVVLENLHYVNGRSQLNKHRHHAVSITNSNTAGTFFLWGAIGRFLDGHAGVMNILPRAPACAL